MPMLGTIYTSRAHQTCQQRLLLSIRLRESYKSLICFRARTLESACVQLYACAALCAPLYSGIRWTRLPPTGQSFRKIDTDYVHRFMTKQASILMRRMCVSSLINTNKPGLLARTHKRTFVLFALAPGLAFGRATLHGDTASRGCQVTAFGRHIIYLIWCWSSSSAWSKVEHFWTRITILCHYTRNSDPRPMFLVTNCIILLLQSICETIEKLA